MVQPSLTSLSKAGLALGLAACFASAQNMTTTHPGFTIQDIRPTALKAQVGGMDFLPDGRMVICTWYNFSSAATKYGTVYIVDKAQSGDKAQVTYKEFATGINEPLGVKVVDSVIYIMAKDALLRLPDANKDDKADKVETVVKGWAYHSEEEKPLEFALGLLNKKGIFYTGLATRWPVDAAQSKERGCILTLDPAKPNEYGIFACGMRTPNGLVLGPEDELFTTENQGNWVPDSKLIHLQKDHFYGVKKTSGPSDLESKGETPPAVWIPHGQAGTSPTQPVYVKTGIFKGQMIAGDNCMGTLQRYFLEKVQGEYQGMVIKFSAGIEAGANRIVTGPDGAIYIGGEGVGGEVWGGWAWGSKIYGLARMTEKTTGTFFDVKAIRSLGPESMEVEFTEPAADAAGQASSYTVGSRSYSPTKEYGCCKTPTNGFTSLTVTTATLSADKKKVVLKVTGLKTKTSVNIQFTNLKSASGNTIWANQAWYTLNAFGPGVDAPEPSVPVMQAKAEKPFRSLVSQNGRLHLPAFVGSATLEVLDITGKVWLKRSVNSQEIEIGETVPRGLYQLRLFPSGTQAISQSLLIQ